MITCIRKRDGRTRPFDTEKIANAIYKAAQAIGGHDYQTSLALANRVSAELEAQLGETPPTVEQVQDTVERVLIENGHARTAKEFILYRAERTRIREMNTRLMKTMEDLTFQDAKDNDVKRENANIDGDSPMGTMLKYGSESAKQFYEMFILKPAHSEAHRNGDIHIHDLDFLTLTTTCCQIDIQKLFRGGFGTGHGFLREPNDIASYAALACIAIQSNQNDQHGGQSIPNFDYGMADGVKKTYRRLYRQNLARALDLLTDAKEPEETAKKLIAAVEDETGTTASLSGGNGFDEAVLEALLETVDRPMAEKILAFVRKRADEETDRATYQAMEALVHNLNTMHSRAGAQIPFSSINYGLDTTPEGRMVIRNEMCIRDRTTSSMAFLIRSSKSPRYLVPATIPVRSRVTTRLPRSSSGTSSAVIFWASPSAMAVLPTPGSPIRQGLFLVRRDRIWITRSISFPRPITGSSLPSFAMAVKSRPNWSSVGVLPGPLAEEEAPPRMPSEAV